MRYSDKAGELESRVEEVVDLSDISAVYEHVLFEFLHYSHKDISEEKVTKEVQASSNTDTVEVNLHGPKEYIENRITDLKDMTDDEDLKRLAEFQTVKIDYYVDENLDEVYAEPIDGGRVVKYKI